MSRIGRAPIAVPAGKGITITEQGLARAQEVISKHKTLTSFFENVLCLEPEESENNACKIEHVISSKFFDRLKEFQRYCESQPKFIDKFNESLKNK